MIRRFLVAGTHGLACLVLALILQQLYQQRHNTLHHNGDWISSKVEAEYGILGAVAFLTTRTALNRERLNLGVWHKYHEIVHRQTTRVASLELDFRLGGPGYLVVFHDKDARGFAGVRLSRNPVFETACLAGDEAGEFTAHQPLETQQLDDRWHHLALRAVSGGFRVFVDDVPIGVCERRHSEPTRIGLRGSASKRIYVDNLVVEAVDGSPSIRESFDNRRGGGQVLLVCFGAVALLYAAVIAATVRSRRRSGQRLDLYLATTHLVLFLTLVPALMVDRYILGRRHPSKVDFFDYPNRIEAEGDVVRRLAEVAEGPKPADVYRILFIGGSQTWGSGARSREDTWFDRLEGKLNAEDVSRGRVECLSAGIPAYKAAHLYPIYVAEWHRLDPDVVVLNVGHNDHDPVALSEALEQFVSATQAEGVRLVLIPEANTTENRRSLGKLHARHEALRKVAKRHGLAVIETHDYLDERRDSGFLWWDRVHLAPFGQELLARRLYEARGALFGEVPPPTE